MEPVKNSLAEPDPLPNRLRAGQTRINVLSRLVLDFSRTGNGCGCVNIKNLSHREQNNMHTAALSRLSFYFGSKLIFSLLDPNNGCKQFCWRR